MKSKLLFYLCDIAVYPLLIYVVVPFLVRRMDFGGSDAAGAGMAQGFTYVYGCIFVVIVWFIVSFFLAKCWAGSVWHAIPALAGGLFVMWLPPQIADFIESNRITKYTDYYESGVPSESGKYIGGDRYCYHGKITFYREDGTIERTEHWRRGQQNGLKQSFYENGQLASEGDIRWFESESDGAREGIWKFYREDGTPEDERTYEAGKVVASKNYRYYWVDRADVSLRLIYAFDNHQPYTGLLEMEGVTDDEVLPFLYTGQIIDGAFDGVWSGYFKLPGTPPAASGCAVKGRSEGVYTAYYPNGQLRTQCVYRTGVLDGEYVSYYADSVAAGPHGKRAYHCVYADGKRNGTVSWYREDGSLDETCEYVGGLRHGVKREYDSAGMQVRESRYSNDEPLL